jgi:hypothetical protein
VAVGEGIDGQRARERRRTNEVTGGEPVHTEYPVDAEGIAGLPPGLVEFDSFHAGDGVHVGPVLRRATDHDVRAIAVGARDEDVRCLDPRLCENVE